MIHRTFFKVGSALASLAVVFGAFGAHLLKSHLTPEKLNSFQTGVQYQMTHSIALLIAGLLYRNYGNKQLKRAGYLFMLGIVFFSGSIYGWLLLEQLASPLSIYIVMVTPLGGLFFITGWLYLFISIPKGKFYRQPDDTAKGDSE